MFHHSRGGASHARASLLIATALTAALATVTGCSTGPAPRPGAAQSQARQEAAALAVLTDDATSLRQRWQLFGTQQVLVQQCMQRLGLRYLVTSTGPEPAAGVTTADTIGTATPPSYEITGPPVGAIDGVTAQDRYVSSLAPAARERYLAAYNGSDTRMGTLTLPSGAVSQYLTGGCEGQARTELYGSVRAAMEDTFVPQNVNGMFQNYLTTDRPYQSALGTWQRCMAQAGWQAGTPAAAIQAIRAQAAVGASPASLAGKQHSEAATDRRCDTASGLRGTLVDQRKLFLKRQPASTLARLNQIEQARQSALARTPTAA
ncbi:hypothetical protein OG407_00345 [Streptomyces sp. NBC_01515]|uniref:hypothetical protein n=1 Tax=Streptomyces sp. NBC_01515 TaxID=2903890 RepID=UPI0038646A00